MVQRWVVPIVLALIGAMADGPMVGLLAGIFAALVWPPFSEWWHTSKYLRLVERQRKFLAEYDVCAVSPADYEKLFRATVGETDSNTAFLLNSKALREARFSYPTFAKTAADKKAAWGEEEARRRNLGLPNQEAARSSNVVIPYYKPHYEHLKSGIKVPSCWLCDQNTEEQDREHLKIWSRAEREDAEAKAKDASAKALFGFSEIPAENSITCEEAEKLYIKLNSKREELHAGATDWKDKASVSEGHSLIIGQINAARACGKYGPCTVHVPRT